MTITRIIEMHFFFLKTSMQSIGEAVCVTTVNLTGAQQLFLSVHDKKYYTKNLADFTFFQYTSFLSSRTSLFHSQSLSFYLFFFVLAVF